MKDSNSLYFKNRSNMIYNLQIISILQKLNVGDRSNVMDMDQDVGNGEGNSDSNWVETAAFCKDPAFPVAATGTVNGEIFIWDISKQVLLLLLYMEPYVTLCSTDFYWY